MAGIFISPPDDVQLSLQGLDAHLKRSDLLLDTEPFLVDRFDILDLVPVFTMTPAKEFRYGLALLPVLFVIIYVPADDAFINGRGRIVLEEALHQRQAFPALLQFFVQKDEIGF
jgi:hypothetical protein